MDNDLLVTAALLAGGVYLWRTTRFSSVAAIEPPAGDGPTIKTHAHSGEQPTTEEPHIDEEDSEIAALKNLIAQTQPTSFSFHSSQYYGGKTPLGVL